MKDVMVFIGGLLFIGGFLFLVVMSWVSNPWLGGLATIAVGGILLGLGSDPYD